MSVVDDSFEHPMKLEEHAVMPLAGGLMGYGYQCGMLWGAALAAGAQAYRLYGTGPKAETEAVVISQKLVKVFRARAKHIDCSDITELDLQRNSQKNMTSQVMKFFLKGGPIICFSNSASYARTAYNEINTSLAEQNIEAPCSPASCASVLMKKMGYSDLHAVMAAGFAGGIGLSGSACGALGAAIWVIGLSEKKDGDQKTLYDNPKAIAAIDRYLKSTDYEFECDKVVGRKFDNVSDHAEYIQNGGCAEIINALAVTT
jgi:hypothetical protein